MRKITTIAFREYKAMVGTKAFTLSIIMMPLLMLGSILVMGLVQQRGEIKTREIAVIDHVGIFYDVLVENVAKRNQRAANTAGGQSPLGVFTEKYSLQSIIPTEDRLAQLAELSDRIRDQSLYAILEIPADVKLLLDADALPQTATAAPPTIRFYSEESSFADAKQWAAAAINRQIRDLRLIKANVDPKDVAVASVPVAVNGMGLVGRSKTGAFVAATNQDPALQAIFVPLGVMVFMFAVIFMAAQPMLESVLEEKSQRIAEVLLGSVNAFQLLFGKLIGTVSGSLTVFVIYSIGMLLLAYGSGTMDQIPFQLAPWFVTFQILGVLFYASIFLAIGASVSQLKEAQALLLPVWMMMMSPMFVWLLLIRDPVGRTATLISLFPPATPMAMMVRLASGRSIPWWQPVVGALLLAISALAVVYIASRIFRTGILWQGKTPSVREILRWGLRG